MMRKAYSILGLPFDNVNLSQASLVVDEAVKQQQACFMTTPNLNFVIAAQTDPAFYQSVVDSDLIIADGMPLIWVAKLLGLPFHERVAGSSLFSMLQSQKRERPIKVFFFGGEEGVAEKAHRQLNIEQGGVMSCGYYDPGFVSVEEMSGQTIIDRINDAEPDFVLVALGAQKGQAWLQANKSRIHAPIKSHLGAVINFVAGHIERAPEHWQQFGLEWLWRIKQEPSLWRRYWRDGWCLLRLCIVKVLPLMLYERLHLKRWHHQTYRYDVLYDDKQVRLVISGSVTQFNIDDLIMPLQEIVEHFSSDVVIDCANLQYIDSAMLGTLLLFQARLQQQQRSLVLSNISKALKRLFFLHHVSHRFEMR